MVRHFLSDGREVQNIEGYKVPYEGATAAAYHIVADFIKKNLPENEKGEKQCTDLQTVTS